MNVPSYEEVTKLGYSLYGYSGDKESAMYSKGPLTLKVRSNGTATLSAIVGLVEMEIKEFSFPHPLFDMFEDMLATVWQGASEADQKRKLRVSAERGDF